VPQEKEEGRCYAKINPAANTYTVKEVASATDDYELLARAWQGGKHEGARVGMDRLRSPHIYGIC
jgi:hypothetical protein